MSEAVYIVICNIPTYSGTKTLIDKFNSLPEAQAYKTRIQAQHKVAFCDIYKSYKEEE